MTDVITNERFSVQSHFLCFSFFTFPELDMAADLMWGGVPFTIPSVTAMKYISGAVKVKVSHGGGKVTPYHRSIYYLTSHFCSLFHFTFSYQNEVKQRASRIDLDHVKIFLLVILLKASLML